MHTKTRIIILLFCSMALSQPVFGADPDNAIDINSLVIMPVSPHITTKTNKAKAAQLQDGAVALAGIISDYFANNPKVSILTQAQTEAETGDFEGSDLKMARHLGAKLGVDGILICDVDRFVQRQGDKYSIDVPASVAFGFKLIHIKSGRTICNSTFSETQKALTEDLFSIAKAISRGFKWVSATELAREGIEKKFSQCQYLP